MDDLKGHPRSSEWCYSLGHISGLFNNIYLASFLTHYHFSAFMTACDHDIPLPLSQDSRKLQVMYALALKCDPSGFSPRSSGISKLQFLGHHSAFTVCWRLQPKPFWYNTCMWQTGGHTHSHSIYHAMHMHHAIKRECMMLQQLTSFLCVCLCVLFIREVLTHQQDVCIVHQNDINANNWTQVKCTCIYIIHYALRCHTINKIPWRQHPPIKKHTMLTCYWNNKVTNQMYIHWPAVWCRTHYRQRQRQNACQSHVAQHRCDTDDIRMSYHSMEPATVA